MKICRYSIQLILTSAVVAVLTGCSSLGLKIANIPAHFFDGTIERNVTFDNGNQLKLDIYIPTQAEEQSLPVIVFFYGGRWSYGEKEDYEFAATALADEGFVVVVPDYRKYPDVTFPAFVEDGAKAIHWVHTSIAKYNGQPNTIFMSGHSAGAHTGALLASDTSFFAPYETTQTYTAIKGFAGLAGPYDFVPEAKDLVEIFGPEELFPQMQIPTFIQGTEPPMLLLGGKDDTTVEQYNMDGLDNAIQAKNGAVKTIVYDDLDHIEIVGALSRFWRAKAPVLKDMTAFFKAQL